MHGVEILPPGNAEGAIPTFEEKYFPDWDLRCVGEGKENWKGGCIGWRWYNYLNYLGK
jgi:hypothetical protein